MRYLLRLIVYAAIFFASFSVGYVLILKAVPVTITPLKVIRLVENAPDNHFVANSRYRPLNKINHALAEAVIASEDNFFLTHNGFDWEAIDLAIKNNKTRKRKLGASTISQQTAKNVFCTPKRTWVRKGFETYFTVLIELFWSKREIMGTYLNVIETHPDVYGAEETSRRFYGKHASELNVYEASMIATVLPSPRRMNLSRPSSYMVRRAGDIRRMMNRLPKADFDDPADPAKPEKKRRK